jgi:hypothetical protein
VSPGQDRWIGLQGTGSLSNPASWTWITGEPNTFAHWSAGEPNGSGPCARMKTDGTWGDQTCNTSLTGVCERE